MVKRILFIFPPEGKPCEKCRGFKHAILPEGAAQFFWVLMAQPAAGMPVIYSTSSRQHSHLRYPQARVHMAKPQTVPAAMGPPTTLLFNDWYPAMRSERLRGNKLVKQQIMGIPLVLGRRRDGRLFAMRDACPHRGIPLSCGWFDGMEVTCKYHGWAFEPVHGQCTVIPSLTRHDTLDCTRIYATAFPCEERDGYAWVYFPEPGSGRVQDRSSLPPVPEVPKFSTRFRSAHLSAELPCNVDHGIIGLMDPAHGPFVHQAWWWRSRASIHEKEKHFEPIPQGFRMASHQPSGNSAPYKLLGIYGEPITTTIDFVLPNRRYETIRCGDKWFASLTTVTPTTENHCRIDVCAAWNVFLNVPLVTPIAKFFGRRFVEQDQVTMIQQAEGLR